MDVDWLIIADSAQVVGGKLFLLGGGWDRLTLNQPPPRPHSMAVAVAVAVPWHETNRKHLFKIDITDGDGTKSLATIEGEFEVGRNAGLVEGQPQRMQLAGNLMLNIPQFGSYSIVASIDGEEKKSVPFYVVAGPGAPAKSRQP